MSNATLTPYFLVHLVRIDGTPIDTRTGTLAYEHGYRRRNGKPFTKQQIARKWAKTLLTNFKGYRLDRIDVRYFDPNA